MKYAVVMVSGHQYKVSEGDTLLVDKIEGDVVSNTLLYVSDSTVEVGAPTLENHAVTFKKLADEKGEKIHIRTFKAKSRYRKHKGYRASYTRLSVEKIA
jgi:large subunit ribosomal protein L21